ncbi:BMS1, partial [Symbiodinium microadriaticum]
TVAEIRRDQSIAIPVNKDSLYKPITRALPFASKPKQQATKNKKSFAAKRAVVLEPEDRRKRAAVQMLETIRKDKVSVCMAGA